MPKNGLVIEQSPYRCCVVLSREFTIQKLTCSPEDRSANDDRTTAFSRGDCIQHRGSNRFAVRASSRCRDTVDLNCIVEITLYLKPHINHLQSLRCSHKPKTNFQSRHSNEDQQSSKPSNRNHHIPRFRRK